MLRPVNGDIVEMRDGRHVYVTDAADGDQPQYFASHPITGKIDYFDGPVESIFVGRYIFQLGDNVVNETYIETKTGIITVGGTVTSDMSEIVSIRD